MTERKKITLSRPAGADSDTPSSKPEFGGRKPPVRGSGTAPRKRMTAAEAEQARAEAAARGPGGWQGREPGRHGGQGADEGRRQGPGADRRRGEDQDENLGGPFGRFTRELHAGKYEAREHSVPLT